MDLGGGYRDEEGGQIQDMTRRTQRAKRGTGNRCYPTVEGHRLEAQGETIVP
jgi:hypothetical protein